MDASSETIAGAAGTATAGEEGNRRGDILHAAGRLFRQKGYKGTTIRDIAAAVGMRSGSPFYHFKTKHDMLCAVVLDGIETMHAALVEAAAEPDPRQRFKAMAHAHMNALLGPDGRDFAAVMLHECGNLEPEAAARIHERKDAYEAQWSKTLDELAAIGALRGDMHLTKLLLLGGMNWSTQWFSEQGSAGPDDIARQLTLLLIGEA